MSKGLVLQQQSQQSRFVVKSNDDVTHDFPIMSPPAGAGNYGALVYAHKCTIIKISTTRERNIINARFSRYGCLAHLIHCNKEQINGDLPLHL